MKFFIKNIKIIVFILFFVLLANTSVLISQGVPATGPSVSIQDSFLLGNGPESNYLDTILIINCSPIITPTMFVTGKFLGWYSERYGEFEIYGNYIDNDKFEKRELEKNSLGDYEYDPYDFTWIYLLVIVNIFISLIFWFWLFGKIKRKAIKNIFIIISILTFLWLLFSWFIQDFMYENFYLISIFDYLRLF